LLTLLSVCVWMPLGLALIAPRNDGERQLRRRARRLHAGAAVALGAAFAFGPGTAGALLALPWLVTTVMYAAAALLRLRPLRGVALADVGAAAALVYPLVGAGWALCACAGFEPLGFAPTIVLLTATHFHHAGFVLPVAAACALRRQPRFAARTALLGVIAGMPLTAAGITATRFGMPAWIERSAALATAGFALLVAWLHLRAALDPRLPTRARILLGTAGGALVVGMALAALFAARHVLELTWLADEATALTAMVWTHALCNGLLFAAGAVFGWRAAGLARTAGLADCQRC
jgi:YndJ-like protein